MTVDSLKEILWKQFGAAIDMLENAILACPDELWNGNSNFWYQAYHCLFYLDYYSSKDVNNFFPPSPFTLSELDPEGVMPERVYTKDELLAYLQHGKNKCHSVIAEHLKTEFQNTKKINPPVIKDIKAPGALPKQDEDKPWWNVL